MICKTFLYPLVYLVLRCNVRVGSLLAGFLLYRGLLAAYQYTIINSIWGGKCYTYSRSIRFRCGSVSCDALSKPSDDRLVYQSPGTWYLVVLYHRVSATRIHTCCRYCGRHGSIAISRSPAVVQFVLVRTASHQRLAPLPFLTRPFYQEFCILYSCCLYTK